MCLHLNPIPLTSEPHLVSISIYPHWPKNSFPDSHTKPKPNFKAHNYFSMKFLKSFFPSNQTWHLLPWNTIFFLVCLPCGANICFDIIETLPFDFHLYTKILSVRSVPASLVGQGRMVITPLTRGSHSVLHLTFAPMWSKGLETWERLEPGVSLAWHTEK